MKKTKKTQKYIKKYTIGGYVYAEQNIINLKIIYGMYYIGVAYLFTRGVELENGVISPWVEITWNPKDSTSSYIIRRL